MTPDEITPQKARTELLTEPDWLESNRKYVGTHVDLDGDVDHWQDGEGFRGPKPSKNDGAHDVYMQALKEVFITEDLVSEVVERRRKGVTGQPPTIEVAPLDEEEQEQTETEHGEAEAPSPSDEIASTLTDWWTERDLTDTLGEAVTTLSAEERCVLRLVIDPGRLNDANELDASTPEEALSALRVDVMRREQATVHEDIRTRQKAGIIVFEGDRAGRYNDDAEYVEKTWVDEQGRTHLTIEDEGGVDEAQFDMDGHLLHKELELPLLVNESLRSNQAGLNTTRTMINITGQKAGFPELHLVNVLAPEDEDGNEVEPERGPGKIQYHVSVPKKAQSPTGQTEERSGTADVVETDPVDNESLRSDAHEARESVYRTAHQLHVFMSGDATASGKSRVQARADFVSDLEDVAEVLGRGGAWICEAAWQLAHALVGQSAPSIGVTLTPTIDPGPVTPEEKKEIREAWRDDFISRHTALRLYGVDDVQAELERVEEEETERFARRNARNDDFVQRVQERRQQIEEGAQNGTAQTRESNRQGG